MGIGSARGEGRAVQAAQKAISSPLLEASMDGAYGVLLSIAGGSDLGLFEINEAASLVQEAAHEEANIIFGTVIDDSLGDEVRITVIAAGFDSSPSRPGYQRPPGARPAQPAESAQTGRPPVEQPAPARAFAPAAPTASYTTSAPTYTAPAPSYAATATLNSPRPASRLLQEDDDDDVDVPPFMKR
jgi:cell division protein FtsZ